MWLAMMALSWLFASQVTSMAVTPGGICCKLRFNLARSYPAFLGYCTKIGTFDPHGTTYDCGGHGFVMYRPGAHDPHHPGETTRAEFELKTNPDSKDAAVLVMLHCDPAENPGLRRGFIVADRPFFCASSFGQTFGPLESCVHPRISYRMTPTIVEPSECF